MSRTLRLAICASIVLVVIASGTSTRTGDADCPSDTGASLDAACPTPEETATPSTSSLAEIRPPKELVESHEAIQTPEEVVAHDLALAAEATGWTLEQAAEYSRVSEIAGRLAAQLSEARPDTYVGGALSGEPGGTPSLYIKGPADDFAKSLVASAEIEVNLVDNQPYSASEMQGRQRAVIEAIRVQGFKNASVGSRPQDGGRIGAEVALEPGLPDDPPVILAGIPESLRDSVDLTVRSDYVSAFYRALGGMSLLTPGPSVACTSGWPVWDAIGATGVTTAGHCLQSQIAKSATPLIRVSQPFLSGPSTWASMAMPNGTRRLTSKQVSSTTLTMVRGS